MEVDRKALSPMMQQYFEVKDKYKDHIVFYRLGDFYEMFFDDAVTVSKVLELTLTGRDCGLEERAPMCGVPYHSADSYIKRLIDRDFKVVICEQTEDPRPAKGLEKREVIRVVTPGTLTESSLLDDSKNNYIACVFIEENRAAVCFTDISTGSVSLCVHDCKNKKELESELINDLSMYSPAELLFNDGMLDFSEVKSFIKDMMNISCTMLTADEYSTEKNMDILLKQFSADSVSEIGLSGEDKLALDCICGMFFYISETQKAVTGRFTAVDVYDDKRYMELDMNARRNLELCETIRGKERRGSLIWVLDHTETSMGRRLLKGWIEQPLVKPAEIIDRLNAVEELCKSVIALSEITEQLGGVYDLERLMTRVVYKTANPRDVKSLSQTALRMPQIKESLGKFSSPLLKSLEKNIHELSDISNLVENAIVDEPPVAVKDGGVIKDGFNSELDRLRGIIENGEGIIAEIERRERERTGIKNLKVGYNRVFGYYIEVTKSYYDLVPPEYIRKQTLANCERFITDELKKTEEEIMGANEKVLTMEADIFAEVRDYISSRLEEVQETASAIAALDVLCSFADVSMKNRYVKPDISADGVIDIRNGRHPVVELVLKDSMYVPNDAYLDLGNRRMSVITGPNMSGKSTYMRQTALIVLMAQIGCFVPADSAHISICDKIFTRVGALDDLAAGQSTFMVEMSEVADILRSATSQSLVILDEVGRGTSTFDGISIATAVAEYIASRKIGCKTMFATHYHELIALEGRVEGVKNYSVAVSKHGDSIHFLRKIVEGGVDDSYGIEVAKLAGLPKKVITRARELLEEMELEKQNASAQRSDSSQISFGAMKEETVLNRLKKTNPDEFSDADAKAFLKEICDILNGQ